MKIVIPEKLSKNHNVSPESDFHFVARYVGFFLALITGLYLFLHALAFVAIQCISIDKEIQWFGSDSSIAGSKNSPLGLETKPLPNDLQLRYKDVKYNISIIDMDGEENAFAGLGGDIYLTQALLENIQYYQALDMIVGHEIGHIENRDVLRGLITKVPITLIASMIGDSGVLLSDNLLSNPYSRRQESNGDKYGLDFTHKLNGHVGCSMEYFDRHNNISDNLLGILSDHPITELRIQTMQKYIAEKGYTIGKCNSYEYTIN